MAGNVGVLKHASNVPQCALALEDLFTRAGFPANAFQTLLIGSDVVESLIDDPRVAAVTLTGSEGAGRAVAGAAGRNLKKCVVELGGSDPFVVMPSAPLELAVQTAVQARMINNGQSCIAAKRFIVHEQILNAFSEQFVARVRALRVGDPMDPATDIGPLATESIARDLDDQVRRTVAAGATVLVGGQRLDRPGSYYAPTVLTHVPLDSAAAREELFGPVAPLLPARDVDDALRIANDSTFGLGSAAWSSDPDELGRFARELEAGSVALNGMVVSDPRLPFGGVKHSGFGRELSDFGIREFVNVKSVRSTRHGQQMGSVTE
jgi:succinate-semialdehyde dehydrogenase/glutarate-semialdehyde dehydrogenase